MFHVTASFLELLVFRDHDFHEGYIFWAISLDFKLSHRADRNIIDAHEFRIIIPERENDIDEGPDGF
jgi:hypothetical protein